MSQTDPPLSDQAARDLRTDEAWKSLDWDVDRSLIPSFTCFAQSGDYLVTGDTRRPEFELARGQPITASNVQQRGQDLSSLYVYQVSKMKELQPKAVRKITTGPLSVNRISIDPKQDLIVVIHEQPRWIQNSDRSLSSYSHYFVEAMPLLRGSVHPRAGAGWPVYLCSGKERAQIVNPPQIFEDVVAITVFRGGTATDIFLWNWTTGRIVAAVRQENQTFCRLLTRSLILIPGPTAVSELGLYEFNPDLRLEETPRIRKIDDNFGLALVAGFSGPEWERPPGKYDESDSNSLLDFVPFDNRNTPLVGLGSSPNMSADTILLHCEFGSPGPGWVSVVLVVPASVFLEGFGELTEMDLDEGSASSAADPSELFEEPVRDLRAEQPTRVAAGANANANATTSSNSNADADDAPSDSSREWIPELHNYETNVLGKPDDASDIGWDSDEDMEEDAEAVDDNGGRLGRGAWTDFYTLGDDIVPFDVWMKDGFVWHPDPNSMGPPVYAGGRAVQCFKMNRKPGGLLLKVTNLTPQPEALERVHKTCTSPPDGTVVDTAFSLGEEWKGYEFYQYRKPLQTSQRYLEPPSQIKRHRQMEVLQDGKSILLASSDVDRDVQNSSGIKKTVRDVVILSMDKSSTS